MLAYVVGSGSLISAITFETVGVLMEPWLGSLVCVILFAILIYSGTSQVDYFNRILMIGLIIAYVGLVALGSSHVKSEYLSHADWSHAWYVIPPMIISFGFHNLIPSVSNYMGTENPGRLKRAVYLGSGIPLVIYLVWEYIILGIIPVEGGCRLQTSPPTG